MSRAAYVLWFCTLLRQLRHYICCPVSRGARMRFTCGTPVILSVACFPSDRGPFPSRPLLARRSFALAASLPLFADAADKKEKAGAKGAKEKLFNTGAVFGTGAQRTVQLAAVAGPKGAVSRAVPLKGGRGRKKPKVEKKHLLLAARKKQLRKLWGKHTGTPLLCVFVTHNNSGNWAVPERSVVPAYRRSHPRPAPPQPLRPLPQTTQRWVGPACVSVSFCTVSRTESLDHCQSVA